MMQFSRMLAVSMLFLAVSPPAWAAECPDTPCADFVSEVPNPVDCTEALGCEEACGADGPVPGYEASCDEIDWDAPSCPGEGSQIPLGSPDRNPMHFGMLGLFNVKVHNLRAYAIDGPACHFGTNCNTTSGNATNGVMNSSAALYPPGSQIVAGMTRWRSRAAPALADRVFANDFTGDSDGVCVGGGGRQLWCPPLLDAYAGVDAQNPACPSRTDTGDDLSCTDPAPIETLWNQQVVRQPHAAAFARGLIDLLACKFDTLASCLANEASIHPCRCQADLSDGVLADDQDGVPDGNACFWKLTADGGTLEVARGSYLFCQATFEDGVAVSADAPPGGSEDPGITMYARKLKIDKNVSFFWTDPQLGRDVSFCSLVRAGVFDSGSDAALSLGQNTKVSGTFFAPSLKINLGNDSKISGQLIAKSLEGQPAEYYCCRCSDAEADCSVDRDCCSGDCASGTCAEEPAS
jgi:hypothetical protein